MNPRANHTPRRPLTRDRVLRAAVEVADREGLGALTMRRLGTELDVEAMSLYKHVANKDEILDGIVEIVMGEIEIPSGTDWREAMRQRAFSARDVLARHAWAVGLLESRPALGPTRMRYLDAILGRLRSAGFSIETAVYAFWLLDSYVKGHVIQETGIGLTTPEEMTESAGSTLERIAAGEYPHLVEIEEHVSRFAFSFDTAFEFGLDLILDGLDRTPGVPGPANRAGR